MSATVDTPQSARRSRFGVIGLLGATQILGWGSTFYLPGVLAAPIAHDTGWPASATFGGLSAAMLISGFIAPRVGGLIDRYGGRWVLAASSLLLAIGLVTLGTAHNLFVYYAAWAILGCGMATGLYDAAFATLVRLYSATARNAITGLTLIGGFASTVSWPTVALLADQFGWRGACFVLAGLHVGVGAVLHARFLPMPTTPAPARPSASTKAPDAGPDRRFLYLAIAFMLFSSVAAGISVNALDIFRSLGLDAAAAVIAGMVIGPAQVGGRIIEFSMGRGLHPLWTARGGITLVISGILMLALAGPVAVFVAVAIYGAGNGIMTIARGTLPLALFGEHGYGVRMGRLAQPMVVVQAFAPFVTASVLDYAGPQVLLAVAFALGLAALGAFGLLRVR